MGRDCNIDPSQGYGDFRKTSPVLVDSRFRLVLYHRQLFQGQRSLRRLSFIEMAKDNDVLWSTEVGGSEDFFFIISMLKSALNFVLSLSATSTYDSQYASASELPAASLNGRFEHAVISGEAR